MKFASLFVILGVQIFFCLCPVWTKPRDVRDLSTFHQVEWQCGISISVPLIKDAFDQYLYFKCDGAYKERPYGTVINMDIQYPPYYVGGGPRIGFLVDNVSVYSRIAGKRGGIIQQDDKGVLMLSPCMAFGDARRAVITEIKGPNWRGWIAEEPNTKPFRRSNPYDWFATKFRCIHLTIGNNKMTAQLGGVCLLRKRMYNLEEGFSYDVFMDMLKTLRFVEE